MAAALRAAACFFFDKCLSGRLFLQKDRFDRVCKIFYSVGMWGNVCQSVEITRNYPRSGAKCLVAYTNSA